MKIVVITREPKIKDAKIIMQGVANIHYYSEKVSKIEDKKQEMIKDFRTADVIIAMVDMDFFEIKECILKFNLAYSLSICGEIPVFLPITLEGARIPFLYLNIIAENLNSIEDLNHVRSVIKLKIEQAELIKTKKQITSGTYIKKYTSFCEGIAITGISGMLITIILNMLPWITVTPQMNAIMILFFTISTISYVVFLLLTYKIQNKKMEEIKTDTYAEKLRQTIITEKEPEKNYYLPIRRDEEPEIDALKRMLINLEDIKEFYTWSQKQAKSSFKLAVFMCICGLLMMVGAILLPIIIGLSLQAAVISAIGGAITELIAGTALFVYRNSLTQLNHYHKALHEDERFLSSVNLIGKFSSVGIQDEMLKEIIRSELQMNLFAINNESTSLGKKKEVLSEDTILNQDINKQ